MRLVAKAVIVEGSFTSVNVGIVGVCTSGGNAEVWSLAATSGQAKFALAGPHSIQICPLLRPSTMRYKQQKRRQKPKSQCSTTVFRQIRRVTSFQVARSIALAK